MNANQSQQYQDFFMSSKGGRRHLRLGASSTMDDIIMGRDMDHSGSNPHVEFMSRYGDHAGLKSGDEKVRGRRQGNFLASEMDTVVFGRDFDNSGHNPRAEFLAKYSDHAGMREGGDYDHASKKSGYAMASTMDSVIFGRDFDNSGDDPHLLFQKIYKGFAGTPSSNKEHRAAKKLLVGMSGSMDEILTGRDLDGSDDVWATFQSAHKDKAGVRSGEKPQRPCKKLGLSMQSSADSVIWGRDLDGAWAEVYQKGFEEEFGQSAGVETGRLPKSARRRAAEMQAGALKTSRSEPNLALTIKPDDVQSESQPPSPGKPQPSARSARSCHDGRFENLETGRLSEVSPNSARVQFPGRSSSVGALTARDGRGGSGSFFQPGGTGQKSQRPPSRSNSVGSLTARSCGHGSSPTAMQTLRRFPRSPGSAAGSAASGELASPLAATTTLGCGLSTARDIGAPTPTPGHPRAKPPSRTGSVGSITSRDYGAGCGSPAHESIGVAAPPSARVVSMVPTEKALAAANGGTARVRQSRSQCSTASSSAGSKPRWR